MEAKDSKILKGLLISSLIVGGIAMLYSSWVFGIAAIVLAFFLYRKQENNTESKKHLIIAIIAGAIGCIGIITGVLDEVEEKRGDEMYAKNNTFTTDMKNFISELSSLSIDSKNIKINGGVSGFYKVKSIVIEPKDLVNENDAINLRKDELKENDFTQEWTAKIIIERIGQTLNSSSDTYYTGSLKMVFEDESGCPISETEYTKSLSENDFYKSIGGTIAYEYSFKLGKGKETSALSKIKTLKIDTEELTKGSHYQDELREVKEAWEKAAKDVSDEVEKVEEDPDYKAVKKTLKAAGDIIDAAGSLDN